MFTKSILALSVVCVIIEARFIVLQDTPLKPEGISFKITVKEDRDTSGQPVASVQVYMDDEDNSIQQPDGLGRSNEVTPSLEDRFGIGNGKCPLGKVWRGWRCLPVSG